MKCISWNVRGLRDARRWGIVGRYLREWGAEIILLQETMLTQVDQQIWTSLGWGSGEAHVAIAASGRSGGIILAWKEELFDRASTWTGRHLVAARLINRRDGFDFVVASAYGPTTAALRSEMWDDLVRLQGAHPDSPILIGGDFNVTIMANDCRMAAEAEIQDPANFERLLHP